MRLVRNLTGLLGFLLIWEAVVRAGLIDQNDLPPPTVVFARIGELFGDVEFVRDVVASVLAWLIALLISIAIAVPAGLLLGSVRWLRDATKAIVEFLRPIPSVALIPLVLIVVGGGPEAKITLAVYAAVWPILFNTIYALAEIDPLLLETARTYGTPRSRVLTSVALPHAAPFVFTGIRLSAAISLILVISTEFLAGAKLGIGQFVLEASSGPGRMDLVLAGTVVAGLLGYLVNEGLERLGNRLFRWSSAVEGAAA
ncbi:ABC transporter permease [Amycolatopsis rubida]|uniref:ABC transporter permease n=2 Tax=Amycolatopsis TaxID=1813 RepID=A0A1I5GQS8_9PSEU|nr:MULTISPECIES: ABC transporter permease [Amycolatopsis]MBB1160066.1 ABC transporter permease [Amycolatopsis dendrobii]MYW95422.1 ABC transporter permease subunit [Amycolatopsis rubida]NEC60411.1 ABC transporter permease [Amycolatopsis rubida]OAP20379.1 Bicarbonate transport system permease protein CmpB [Amycolatopsis sp. M39]UKD52508.1 ABC transporter permease [Amycolatopsis sp. FU40]